MAPFLVAMSLGCLGTAQFCFAVSVCCMMLTLFKRKRKKKKNLFYYNMELWLIDDFFFTSSSGLGYGLVVQFPFLGG